jgi:putative transposase
MRLARAVAVGQPHHITQRGNYKQDVFITDGDRMVYLEWLAECAERHGVRVWAYCLMSNHIHLVAVPEKPNSLARCLAQVHMRHSQRLNRRGGQRGHLWQGRFYSCALDERHTWAAVRYVETNPVHVGIARRAEEYPWSSAAARCGLKTDGLLAGDFPPPGQVDDWRAWLAEGETPELVSKIRANTHTGRPCGDQAFVTRIEELLGRVLAARRIGRPGRARKA